MTGYLKIGQLAKRVGVENSTLRYYDEQQLVQPAKRSAAGYRLYHPDAEMQLRFIQRAQRLGFSLADIRKLLQADQLSEEELVQITEHRYLVLEQQLTEKLVQRHEMELLLREIDAHHTSTGILYSRLLDRVCHNRDAGLSAGSAIEWLLERTDCALSSSQASGILDRLEGIHVHIWQGENDYRILVISQKETVRNALEELIQLEGLCDVHQAPRLIDHTEGLLLIVRGEQAFIFAQLFLALEKNRA